MIPENAIRLRVQQNWLDNEELQVDCTDEELAAIGIIPGMVRSRSLKFWQGHAIWKLWWIWTEEKTKITILADSLGLCKTIEGIGSILTVTELCRKSLYQANTADA